MPAGARPLGPEPERSCFKPRLSQLLGMFHLDVAYERGQGDHLFYRDAAGHEVTVLDLVGGYGSLLFGHAHPTLVREAQRFLAAGRPMHAQGSRRVEAARLARALADRACGDFCVVFANSGAEAVEASLKHAMLETGGRTFIALERAFHGKTLGALQLTASAQHRGGFEIPGLHVRRVALNDLDELESAFAQTSDLAGFVFEPIQGEGGVRRVDAALVRRAAQLCAERGVPLIADECQTGFGRVGTFLACETLGVQPDYILLAKALGGGLAKIAALLVRAERYRDEFDLKHTSTYAEDDFSCVLALKALELLDESMLADCRTKGAELLAGLRHVAAEFPTVIADVRGQGLMLALEFRPLRRSPSFLLRFLSAQEDLAYLIAGYLLQEHRIRIAPTLSDRFSLRLEPSALIDSADIRRLMEALSDVCGKLAQGDALALTRFLSRGAGRPTAGALARHDAKFVAYDEAAYQKRPRVKAGAKVAWLCHLIDADDFVSLEPAFGEMPLEERETFLAGLVPGLAPVVMSTVEVRSRAGGLVQVCPILLPFTSRWVKQRLDARRFALPQALVQQGVDLAHALDCRMVSLGQYTSIVTRNGTRLAPRRMGVTSGNSYAIALAIQAIERAQREAGRAPEESVLVIAGAAGNIGRTCATLLAPRYRRTVLIGSPRPGSARRLQVIAGQIPRARAATDLAAVAEGQVVLVALNAVDAPLVPAHFAREAIVCDLSVPAAVQTGTARARPDLVLLQGGIAAMPFGEDLGIVGFPLPRGRTYACMAEAMLLGFAGIRDTTFTGLLTAEHVMRVAALAARHGFTLAEYKRASVLSRARDEEVYASPG